MVYVVCACLFMCLCALCWHIVCCFLVRVSAMLLCLNLWSGLNVSVWFVCDACVMMCGMRLCVVCVCACFCVKVRLCGLVAIHRVRLYALFVFMCVCLCLCVLVFVDCLWVVAHCVCFLCGLFVCGVFVCVLCVFVD